MKILAGSQEMTRSAIIDAMFDRVAPVTEGAGLLLGIVFTGQFGDQMRGNQMANLAQDGEFRSGWTGCFFFFHPAMGCR